MENNQSTGMLIAKLIVFVILMFIALRVAFWLLKVVASLVFAAIHIGVIVLVIIGIYYLLFGRKSKY